MIISLLMPPKLRARLFTPETLDHLRDMSELRMLEQETPDREAVRSLMTNADVAVTSWGSPPMDTDLLDRAPNLRLIAHAAGSVKPIVTPEVFRRDIPVISSAKILSEGVSVTALGMTIAACKDFFRLNTDMHDGLWPSTYASVQELVDLTVGVVGCGFAGRHYIELLAPFDVEVLVYDPGLSDADIQALGAQRTDLDTLVRRSDVVSLHAPSIDATRHMINRDRLGAMKDRAILINTARASLIDTEALADTLAAGKLKYACLDVYDEEPLPADHPIRRFPNCIMTPHLAGLANNGQLGIGKHVLAEIRRLTRGEPLTTQVTEAMLAVIA